MYDNSTFSKHSQKTFFYDLEPLVAVKIFLTKTYFLANIEYKIPCLEKFLLILIWQVNYFAKSNNHILQKYLRMLQAILQHCNGQKYNANETRISGQIKFTYATMEFCIGLL